MKKITYLVFAAFLLGIVLQCVTLAAVVTPDKAYAGYLDAVGKAKSLDNLAPFVTSAKAAELKKMPQQQKDMIIKLMKASAPKTYKVVKTMVVKNSATLMVEGKGLNPFTNKMEKMTGTISLKKEGDSWKIEKESWK